MIVLLYRDSLQPSPYFVVLVVSSAGCYFICYLLVNKCVSARGGLSRAEQSRAEQEAR